MTSVSDFTVVLSCFLAFLTASAEISAFSAWLSFHTSTYLPFSTLYSSSKSPLWKSVSQLSLHLVVATWPSSGQRHIGGNAMWDTWNVPLKGSDSGEGYSFYPCSFFLLPEIGREGWNARNYLELRRKPGGRKLHSEDGRTEIREPWLLVAAELPWSNTEIKFCKLGFEVKCCRI